MRKVTNAREKKNGEARKDDCRRPSENLVLRIYVQSTTSRRERRSDGTHARTHAAHSHTRNLMRSNQTIGQTDERVGEQKAARRVQDRENSESQD